MYKGECDCLSRNGGMVMSEGGVIGGFKVDSELGSTATLRAVANHCPAH